MLAVVSALYLFAVGTVALDIAIISFVAVFMLRNRVEMAEDLWNAVENTFRDYGVELAFLLSIGAATGSLVLSNVSGLEPCLLCWYQRVFMFPLPVILGTGLLLEKRDVGDYAIPLSLFGLAIAVYHYIVQMVNLESIGCAGLAVECSEAYAVHFGYVTIPMMSISLFTAVILALYFSDR